LAGDGQWVIIGLFFGDARGVNFRAGEDSWNAEE